MVSYKETSSRKENNIRNFIGIGIVSKWWKKLHKSAERPSGRGLCSQPGIITWTKEVAMLWEWKQVVECRGLKINADKMEVMVTWKKKKKSKMIIK